MLVENYLIFHLLPRYFLEIGTVIFVLALVYFITWKGENIENLLPENLLHNPLYFGSFLRMLPIFTKLINNFQTLKFGKPVVNTLHKRLILNKRLLLIKVLIIHLYTLMKRYLLKVFLNIHRRKTIR